MHVSIDDTEIYFDIQGASLEVHGDLRVEQRPTLVAIPGGPGFDHLYLKPCLRPLEAFAQVVYVDPRGTGRSGRPPVQSCTLDRMADDVVALCETLGIERPILFGHSGGGFVALTAAVRHPGRLGGLILAHTIPTFGLDDPAGPRLADRASPAAADAAARFFGGDMSAESLARFGELVGPYYVAPGNEAASGVLGLGEISREMMVWWFAHEAPRYDVRGRLGEIRVPTLVLASPFDWVCPPVGGRAIAAGIPGARLVEFERSVHLSMVEEPARFQAEVRSFLGA